MRRTRSSAPGSSQSLNGAPFRQAPGLRASKRFMTRWVAESELSMEFSHARSATRNENSHRTFYYAGLRYEL